MGVTPDMAKLDLTIPECTDHLFFNMPYKSMPPPLSSPTTSNTTFLSQTLHRLTLRQPSTTAQVGLIAVMSIGQAAEVDHKAEDHCVVKRKTSAAITTPCLPTSFKHFIIHIIFPSSPHCFCRGSTAYKTIYIA